GAAEVLNTFLNLGTQVSFGFRHSCFIRDDGSPWCWGRNDAGQLGIGAVSSRESTPVRVSALGRGVAELGGGDGFTCARKRDGSSWCWGRNDVGQLGNGTTEGSTTPVHVVSLGHDVAALGVAHRHGCALRTDGSLWCWGA